MSTKIKLMKLISSTGLLAIVVIVSQPMQVDAASSKHMRIRISHAKELLGNSYKKSAARKTELANDVPAFVGAAIKRFLPKSFKSNSSKISNTVVAEAERYGFDPIFLMAVIQNESSFNPQMKGGAGEIGLMQIKPSTAEWIAKTYKIQYSDAKSLYNPETNIKIGAAFLHKLRSQFNSKSGLYISAYNIGARKVRKMVSGKNSPKVYVNAVMKRYNAIYAAFSTSGNQQEKGQMAWMKVAGVTSGI